MGVDGRRISNRQRLAAERIKPFFQTASGRLNVFEHTPQRVKRNIRPAVFGQGYQPERKSS
ncbi:hypothetical protein NEIELOOT_02458 [Neisseria elongata subsp. glycolytica ATCC 29315]|uniref:Uncharacterized protein n=1 Tax=Neisseria elongata subsp. glycolytica ATCC 29315 TaxID=546263 RepID=D4DTQ3_NEIEG|nr:hypothetical protein NEIELOOT_02458 [Neisseria elongata subsp. glycolytica ATCC 29315]